MPSALHGHCTFDGTAASVRVEGVGRALLLEPDPFGRPNAARVRLDGARIGTEPPSPDLVRPAALEPLDGNKPGQRYDVTYGSGQVGASIVVTLVEGGGDGKLKRADCENGWCTVKWSGDKKTIELWPASPGATLVLSGEFPLGEPGKAPEGVELVEVHGAEGTLRCDDRQEPAPRDWIWAPGSLRDLSVAPIEIAGSKLKVVVKATDPERPGGTPWAGIAVAVLVVAAAVVLLLLARGRRKPKEGGPLSIAQPELRTLIDHVLRDASDFDAFCLDHFPKVHARFTSGMDRKACVNLLFKVVNDNGRILEALRASDTQRVEEWLGQRRAA